MGLFNGKCDRCNSVTNTLKMSFFNTDMCCISCIKKEQLHSKYDEAKRAERQQILKGNYNFAGIGKPADL